MKYTHLLWDFNGTILSDMEIGIISTNQMLRERGLPVIESLEAYREIFDFPIQKYYGALGFDFEKEPYAVLAPIWVDLYNSHSSETTLTPGVEQTLKQVKALGLKQSIISACEIDMLTDMLKCFGIDGYFEHIWGLDNIHAASKLHLAKRWREEHPEAKVLYVGDTVHDAETAEALGADCILYGGGHQSRAKLSKVGCPMIAELSELLQYL